MNRVFKGLALGALLGACTASATGLRQWGTHPVGPTGQVKMVGFYTCPAGDCNVKVTVKGVPDPETGNKCTFTLTGDDGKAFFYIDRNKDTQDQTIGWTVVADPPNWTVQFSTPTGAGKKNGINFSEGGEQDNVDDVQDSPTVQKRKIKKNHGGAKRRSLLLYEIDVNLKDAAGTSIPCGPHGPGILNRGG
jgi:hypothetical protein